MSSLEHDRSILTLSAAGIGLHLTLLTTVGIASSEALVLYIGAILRLAASLLAVLSIFRLNQTHIEDIVASRVTGAEFGKRFRTACLFLRHLLVTLAVMFSGIAATVFSMVLLYRPGSGLANYFGLMIPPVVFLVFFTEFLIHVARKSSVKKLSSSSEVDALDERLRAVRHKLYIALGIGLAAGALI